MCSLFPTNFNHAYKMFKKTFRFFLSYFYFFSLTVHVLPNIIFKSKTYKMMSTKKYMYLLL